MKVAIIALGYVGCRWRCNWRALVCFSRTLYIGSVTGRESRASDTGGHSRTPQSSWDLALP